MGQPNALKYFKKLVYYVISLVVTMNKMVETKQDRIHLLTPSNYARVGELTNNIIDQLFFLQDVLNIQVQVVDDYLKSLLMSDFFVKYCYNVIRDTASRLQSASPVRSSRFGDLQEVIQLRTSLFLLSCVLNTMKDIS